MGCSDARSSAGLLDVSMLRSQRDHASDVHRTVDDRPYGGGPGMVLKVEPLRSALRSGGGQCAARQPAGVPGRRWAAFRTGHGAGGEPVDPG